MVGSNLSHREGISHDDDFGYSFAGVDASAWPLFFDAPTRLGVSGMTETKDNAPTPDLNAELIALREEAERFWSTQQSYTKVIYDVFNGADLLTPESLARVNTAVMIAHQLAIYEGQGELENKVDIMLGNRTITIPLRN